MSTVLVMVRGRARVLVVVVSGRATVVVRDRATAAVVVRGVESGVWR